MPYLKANTSKFHPHTERTRNSKSFNAEDAEVSQRSQRVS